jgi:hypothetical protein
MPQSLARPDGTRPDSNQPGTAVVLDGGKTTIALRVAEPAPAVDAPAVAKRPAKRPRGRPTSKALVIEEVERRLRETDSATLRRHGRETFLDGISKWLRETHPKERQMAGSTIGNHLRENEVLLGLMPKGWLRK